MEDRDDILTLVRKFKSETGEEATFGGKISERFENWRKSIQKKVEIAPTQNI